MWVCEVYLCWSVSRGVGGVNGSLYSIYARRKEGHKGAKEELNLESKTAAAERFSVLCRVAMDMSMPPRHMDKINRHLPPYIPARSISGQETAGEGEKHGGSLLHLANSNYAS